MANSQIDFIAFTKAGIYILALVWTLLVQILNPQFVQFESAMWLYVFLTFGFLSQFLFYNAPNTHFNSFRLTLIDTVLIFFILSVLPVSSSVLLFICLIHVLVSGLILNVKESFIITLLCCGFLTCLYLNTPDVKPFRIFLSLSIHHLSLFSILGLSLYFSNEFINFEKTITAKEIDLKSQEKFLQGVMTHAPSGVVTYTVAGQVILKNPLADSFLNISQNKALNIIDILQSEELAKDFLNSELKHFEFRFLDKIFSVSKNMYWDDRLQSFVHLAIFQDQTEQKKLEQRLRQQEKLAAIGGLAAGIAHEIRNPLAGISGSVELLSQNQNSEEDQKLMRIILKEIQRLNNLVGEFLDYAKPDTPPTSKVNLSFVLNECFENVKNNKSIRAETQFQLEVAPNVFIIGYDDKLKQAFLNMLINAVQATQSVEVPVVKLQLSVTDAEAHVIVSDNGSGISAENKKRLFEPFHTTKPKGTGLGLAITHKILSSHRARVNVHSEVNVGTQFEIIFPLKTT